MASTSSHSQEAQKEVKKQAKGADTKTAEGETTKKPGHVEQDPDGEDPEVLAIAKEDAERAAAMADAVDKVEKFQLDEDFDYDNCPLSPPEWPYDQRPRPSAVPTK
ncbi:unnamed protein product [Durusdinium trenchii]